MRGQSTVDMLVASFEERCHVQNSGIVDEDVESTEGPQGAFHNRIPSVRRHHAVSIRHRLTSCGNDFVGDIMSGSEGSSQTFHVPAEIIHDDLGASSSQLESMGTSETPPSSGDDCYFTFECEAHGS